MSLNEFDDLLGDGPQSSALVKPTNVGLESLTDPEQLLVFLEATKTAVFEAIDDAAVNQGYAAAVWCFRQAALQGDLKTTKALHTWIEWANTVRKREKPVEEEKISNPNVHQFLPRS